MDEVSCLIFELNPYRYAVETAAVAAVIDAAPVVPEPSSSAFVLGEVEVDGGAVPVVDLHRLLGQTESPTPVAGPLVIVQGGCGRVALAPERIPGTRMLAAHGSVRMHNAAGEKPQGWKYVTRLVSIDHTLVMVLDPDALVTAVREQQFPGLELDLDGAVPDEAASERLAASLFEEAQAAPLIAVIRWRERQFGVPLDQVEEFGEVTRLRPLPGCPAHIRGQAVLRGELVTVVEVRSVLGLPLSAEVPTTLVPMTLVIVQQEGERIGIVVDEVREMMTPADLNPPPAGSPPLITATITHGRESLAILDLQELLSSPAVVVDQRL